VLTVTREHLYRRHLLPPQCHRCCTTCADDIALREHQRDLRGCEVREQIPLEGFDKDQERRLKSKKRSQVYQSEEDKWKGVYRILFPDDGEGDMPAPCKLLTPLAIHVTKEAQISNTNPVLATRSYRTPYGSKNSHASNCHVSSVAHSRPS
jgi:hypothetical protein